jgi:hypothetical protein
MKLWTGLVVAGLGITQMFSQAASGMPNTHASGNIPPQHETSITIPSHNLANDLPILWSQGFLALVRSSAPNDTVLSWDAGTVECPDSALSIYLHPKNFGTEEITLCAPVEPETPSFSRITDCACYNALGAGEMSPCSLRIEFHPATDGTFLDTMRMQTNAWNSYGGFVRIPLSGTRLSTPESPNVVLTIQGVDAHLYWNPIIHSEGGCPATVSGYLVFYSPDNSGTYRLLNFTSDTSYVHLGAILNDGGLFYQVVAGTQPASIMRGLQPHETMTHVLSELK